MARERAGYNLKLSEEGESETKHGRNRPHLDRFKPHLLLANLNPRKDTRSLGQDPMAGEGRLHTPFMGIKATLISLTGKVNPHRSMS